MSKASEYFHEDGEPKRCTACYGDKFTEHVTGVIEYTTCEKEVHCDNCGLNVGYWAYGYWDTRFEENFRDYEIMEEDTKVFTAYGKKEDFFEYGTEEEKDS